MAEALPPALSVQDLACTRGGRRVFSGLSFAAAAGEVLQVRGTNGSGKSSLLRLLCGLLPAASGCVQWQGRTIAAHDAQFHGQLAYLGHADGLRGELTVRENLLFCWHLAGGRVDAATGRAALARWGLAAREHEQVRFLSQGQRRRVALVRVLLSQRPLWLLDEPHAGLDTDGEQLFETSLAAHADAGGLAVVATHRTTGDGVRQAQSLDMDGLYHAP